MATINLFSRGLRSIGEVKVNSGPVGTVRVYAMDIALWIQKKIPYGSKVVLGDAICVAVDTGPAVVSRKAARSSGRTASERNAIVIDRFFESKQQAMAWTKTHPHFMTVHVQTPAAQSADNDMRVAANNANNRVPIPEDTTVRTLASFDGFLPQSTLYPAVLASASLCICIALTVRETSNIISPG